MYSPKILFVVGTRPELIKIKSLIRALKESSLDYDLVFTSQFYSKNEINIDISYHLFQNEYPKSLRSAIDLTTNEIISYIIQNRPQAITFVGDTTSAFSAARSGLITGVPTWHIEAGMRTYNNRSPFPEEIFRRSIAKIASVHFCVDQYDYMNLINEQNQINTKIFVIKHPVYDEISSLNLMYKYKSNLILIHLHRRELSVICFKDLVSSIISKFSQNYQICIVSNRRLYNYNSSIGEFNEFMIDPVSHLEFIELITRSSLVITDSGSLQEECSALGVNTIIFRKNTERPYLLNRYSAVLSGISAQNAVSIAQEFLLRQSNRNSPIQIPNQLLGGSREFVDIAKHLLLFE